ncbi:MAG: hypothetical protein ACOC5J_02120, partial [Gemmatimonadota bacterium]
MGYRQAVETEWVLGEVTAHEALVRETPASYGDSEDGQDGGSDRDHRDGDSDREGTASQAERRAKDHARFRMRGDEPL